MKPVSVTQVNEYIARKIDSDFNLRNLAVEGEISGLTRKGHAYFSLKDSDCVIRCVIWRNQLTKIDPKLLEDGKNVIAVGSVRVYSKGGNYSFQIHYMEDAGEGKAKTAFEELKKKLEAEGLFDAKYKKPLPSFPKRIGIVTSTEGDALRDLKKIITKKNSYVDLLVFPAYVQGIYAPASLIQGIYQANEVNRNGMPIDILIVGRGGGSQEDLEAFNDENLARAIFASEIPVISAVGHEPDVSISDYVADVRAATPSEAADIAVPDTEELRETIAKCRSRLLESLRWKIVNEQKHVVSTTDLMYSAMKNKIQRVQHQVQQATIRLEEGSPKRILSKGYAAVLDDSNRVISNIHQVEENQEYTVLLHNGRFRTSVKGIESIEEE